ncbi:MAG TPA: hypothetical protein VG815_16305 [Chloroflexota bacterium]|jgi:hypothetical protein|nr:hypothetical protein [Chloroflexota bacterium]
MGRYRSRRLPTRVNTPDEDAIAATRKAESNAIWFGAFTAVAVLVVLLFVFTGRHLLNGPGVALYVVAPMLAGAAVYVISRPKGPPKSPPTAPPDSIEGAYRDPR